MTAMIGSESSSAGDGRGRGLGARSGADVSGFSTWVAIFAGLAVTCQALIFPPIGAAWIAWIAPLPLFVLFPLGRPAAAALLGWEIGTLQALLITASWLLSAMRTALGLGVAPVAAMLAIESQLVGGLPFALLALLLEVSGSLSPLAFTLFAPSAWVALEYLRSGLPLTAPWALLGSALPSSGLPAQVADLGGVYAVSFVVALPAAACAAALRAGRPGRALPPLALAAAMLVAVALYGTRRVDEVRAAVAAAPVFRVALVHAELSDDRRLSAFRASDNVRRYLELTRGAGSSVDLVVWPENTIAALLDQNPELVARIAEGASDAPYLVGAPRIVEGAPRSLRASAFLIGRSGVEGVYDKRRLLPFAETSPDFGGLGWRQTLAFGIGAPRPLLAAHGRMLGTTICYEGVFPELSRAAVREGAELLVNISNDSWFAGGAGPETNFLLARLRAVENRRALVRVANGGVTALVLPDGRVAARDDGAGALVVAAPLLEGTTLYTRIGDWFAWFCIAFTAVGASTALLVRRSPAMP
jgi:apolipoprotein N-acyltransferase